MGFVRKYVLDDCRKCVIYAMGSCIFHSGIDDDQKVWSATFTRRLGCIVYGWLTESRSDLETTACTHRCPNVCSSGYIYKWSLAFASAQKEWRILAWWKREQLTSAYDWSIWENYFHWKRILKVVTLMWSDEWWIVSYVILLWTVVLLD